MTKPPPFTFVYGPEIPEHLDWIEPKYHGLIKSQMEQQLSHEPDKPTRNRKQLRQPTSVQADWELRLGPDNRFRLFYNVDREQRQVEILAIGVKIREQLFIGGTETTL